jgi:hypothetical protein
VERALSAELTEHLGYAPHAEPPGGIGNARNGSTPKTLVTEHGPVRIDAPRDRKGSFEPQLVRRRAPPLPLRIRTDPRRWSRSCSATESAPWMRSPARHKTPIIARTQPSLSGAWRMNATMSSTVGGTAESTPDHARRG